MIFAVVPEPDQPPTIIDVGQNNTGRWLVQARHHRLEGRFTSQEAIWHFAKAE